MKVEIHSLFFGTNKWINMLIDKKFGELLKSVPGEKRCQVFLRMDKGHLKNDKIIEVKLSVYGKTIFGTHQAGSFETAIHECCIDIRKQIKKAVRVSDLSIN